MYKIKYWMFLAGGLVIFALVGCSATPDEKQLQEWRDLEGPGEMKPGPGLFSGEDGKFTLYSSTKGGVLPKEGKAEAAQTSTRQTTEPTGAAAAAAEGPQAAAQQPAKTSATARDYQKFQEYQQWQKGARSAAEYKEFLEWKEFKAYQEWKKSQH